MECRLCLEKCAKINIFEVDSHICEQLEYYCNIKVYEDDGLPDNICTSCEQRLEEIEEFITKCIENDIILRANLNVPASQRDPLDGGKLNLKESDDLSDNEELPEKLTESEDEGEVEKDPDTKHIESKKKISIHKKRKSTKLVESGRLYRCRLCGKKFSSQKNYVKHWRSHESKFCCDQCGKVFKTIYHLRNHVMTHSVKKNFKCEYCEKTFKIQYSAKLHMKYVHEKSKPLFCSQCNKVFYWPRDLKLHISRSHDPVKDYRCEICPKAFSHKSLLTLHRHVHRAKTHNYKCSYCPMSFSITKTRKEHERLHTGERPYVCPLCPKAYAQNGNMKSHFKHNHKGVDFERAFAEAKSKMEAKQRPSDEQSQ